MRVAAALVVTVVAMAVMALVSVHAAAPPLYPHIAFTHNRTAIYVSYFTTSSVRERSGAKWGLTKGVYTFKATGGSRTYDDKIGYCHDVLLTNITANLRYYYRVGSDTDGWSAEYDFSIKHTETSPTPQNPIFIPIFGDMGITNSKETMESLATLGNKADFFYHVGDISYANDRHSDLYETVWSAWFQNMTNIMPYYPYMVLPGNHEAHSGAPRLKWSEKFSVYNNRFKMPGEKDNMWYSFKYKNIHFISISTETDFAGSEFDYKFGDQTAWLTRELEEANQPANRKLRPWVIVSGHKPLYTSAPHALKYSVPIQHEFGDLFQKYHVDLFFCGHVHAYERTWPVYRNKTVSRDYENPKAVVVVTTGAAGDIEGISKHWDNPPPEFSALRYDKETGYGTLTVESDTTLHWHFYSSKHRALVDKFTLTKQPVM